jgi:hypothetical protein
VPGDLDRLALRLMLDFAELPLNFKSPTLTTTDLLCP